MCEQTMELGSGGGGASAGATTYKSIGEVRKTSLQDGQATRTIAVMALPMYAE